MRSLPKRQVHLDFHTGPDIPDVGKKFNKAQFQKALKMGDIGSITVFAKCHHGLMYYPSKIGKQHPSMTPGFDLTGAMIEAAHEIGVAAPVYITLGWSEADSYAHPEWVRKDENGERMGYVTEEDRIAKADEPRGISHWAYLCPSGEYAELVYRETEEICQRYPDLDGLFYDIVYMGDTCYCDNCVREMKEAGKDPYDIEENRRHYIAVHKRFAKKCGEILHSYHPEATIFFNSGGAEIYRPEYHDDQSHFEMEDLPTAWGGYDKFVARASVMRRYGKEYLGMTGKFHTDWGEFGGYKNVSAMKYEFAMMGMHGAACSIGDQLHPSGRMDEDTYRLIGEGYRFYHAFEPWFFHAEPQADVGVYLSRVPDSDNGLHKMLLEGGIDFSVVMPGDDIDRYRLLILPDAVHLEEEDIRRLRAFRGAVILSGSSLLDGDRYLLDNGVAVEGHSPYDVDYLAAGKLPLWVPQSPFLCYASSYRLRVTDGECLSPVHDPYFSRTIAHYCSHRNTPYNTEPSGYAGIARKGNIITFAHEIFALYEKWGAQLHRDIFLSAVNSVYTPLIRTGLPSSGRVHLTLQESESRYVFHMAYAQPIRRGAYSVIEDIPSFSDIPVTLRLPRTIKEVRVANGEVLPFRQNGENVTFTVNKLHIYTAVELLY